MKTKTNEPLPSLAQREKKQAQKRAIARDKSMSKTICVADAIHCGQMLLKDMRMEVSQRILSRPANEDVPVSATVVEKKSGVLFIATCEEFVLTMNYRRIKKGGAQ